ncbi:hypothetical protein [Luteolibacter soli]|uniref:Major facilitator superfamily (MFS) profile domain-containing protein n=1 Tax=Luteolibacter soli TaxID=3135280 RepID=A0ABU9B1Q4_9BACT
MATASSWIGIIVLILFLGLMSGFWAGIVGLWKARRGAAWWMMAIGITFLTIGPFLYSAGTMILFRSLGSTSASASSSAFSVGGSAIPGLLMAGGLLIPIGLILFSVGFAIHGFAAARATNRAEELEQLTAAMSEEINRLREGGPIA